MVDSLFRDAFTLSRINRNCNPVGGYFMDNDNLLRDIRGSGVVVSALSPMGEFRFVVEYFHIHTKSVANFNFNKGRLLVKEKVS
jgi:hypothetical protein